MGWQRQGLAWIAVVSALQSCAPRATQQFATECKRDGPPSQANTFIGRFLAPPIPIVLDATFTSDEALEIQRAALTWNSFFQAVHGGPMFEVGPLGNPPTGTPPPFNPNGASCAGLNTFINGAWTGAIFVAKRAQVTGGPLAGSGGASGVLALTTSCTGAANQGYQELTGAMIEVNFTSFTFAAGATPGNFDLQTIMTHEFGHLLGLKHAFSSSASVGVPGPDAPSSMLTALMKLVFNPGEQLRRTTTNDQQRANCLYEQVAF